MLNIKKGALLAIAAISAISLSACLTSAPVASTSNNAVVTDSSTSQPIFTDAYFKAHSIPPLSYTNLVFAQISPWLQESPSVDAKLAKQIITFLALTNPEFNRQVEARKVTGTRKETIPDEQIIEKYKPKIISMSPEGKIYWSVDLNIPIVQGGKRVKEYDEKEKGFTGIISLDSYSQPYQPKQFANSEFAGLIQFDPANISIFVPYSKSAYQQQVFDAIAENRPLVKHYKGRFVFRIKDCKKSQSRHIFIGKVMTCAPELAEYQIFDGPNITASQLVIGANARLRANL